ncbi:EAL domain-containing protein [Halobacillus sp. Marseille-Q1614]|uniref:EAL domain-containing protein n=1 Tax=Halobacillus sp. Marseille-Q1614 TaxID=2709134 RepID=UPI00156ECB5C|nr:EAL domain-containing protein [Halobacillus sp. Marseille-Q1614]
MASIDKLLSDRSFSHHFQPIFNLFTWKKAGYEVLLRTEDPSSPEEVFQEARLEGRLYELDTLSIMKAVKYYSYEGYTSTDGLLFFNIYPSTIINNSFYPFIKKLTKDYPSYQLILELSESELINDYTDFNKKLEPIRALGIRVAIDCFGKRYSAMERLVELNPDFLKLDKFLTSGLDLSKEKQFIVEGINNYCNEFGAQLIVKGVEKPNELAIAKYLGVPMAQGYVLAPPELIKKEL